MLVYDYAQGKVTIPLESTREVKVHAAAKTELVLSGLCGKEKVPLETGKNIRFKGALPQEFTEIEIAAHGNGKFGYAFHERIVTEPVLNHESPPAPLVDPNDNLVAQIHRVARQQNALARGTLEPDDDIPYHQRYYVDDDDYTFEEDHFISQQNEEGQKPGDTDVAGASETETPLTAPVSPLDSPSDEEAPPMAAE